MGIGATLLNHIPACRFEFLTQHNINPHKATYVFSFHVQSPVRLDTPNIGGEYAV